jgi:ABC-2 type transport system ATP-binding protein
MIEVRNLTKDYGDRRAIESLNFKVEKGEVVGFLGPNGAGKSTTMKIITGFMAPTSGEALVCGFDVFENPLEVKKRIGYLPETPPVYGDMYVKDYLEFVANLKGVEKNRIAKLVAASIEKTNLGQVQKRLIQNLSKGFRQRVGIAQAIVSDPEVLILDEPTVGLDPKQVAEIRDLIKELRGHHTIILSTHILPEVEVTCERIIIINQGRIAAQETLSNITSAAKGATRRITFRVLRKQDELIAHLSKLPQVVKAVKGVAPGSVALEITGDDVIVEKMASEVVQFGAGLIEMHSMAQLEDVFLKLTYGSVDQ